MDASFVMWPRERPMSVHGAEPIKPPFLSPLLRPLDLLLITSPLPSPRFLSCFGTPLLVSLVCSYAQVCYCYSLPSESAATPHRRQWVEGPLKTLCSVVAEVAVARSVWISVTYWRRMPASVTRRPSRRNVPPPPSMPCPVFGTTGSSNAAVPAVDITPFQ